MNIILTLLLYIESRLGHLLVLHVLKHIEYQLGKSSRFWRDN